MPFNTSHTIIEGYVGHVPVVQHSYNGADAGLSHYTVPKGHGIKPGSYIGTVQFTKITRTITKRG